MRSSGYGISLLGKGRAIIRGMDHGFVDSPPGSVSRSKFLTCSRVLVTKGLRWPSMVVLG